MGIQVQEIDGDQKIDEGEAATITAEEDPTGDKSAARKLEAAIDGQDPLEVAFMYLRQYQAECGIPLLSDEEEHAILEWIVNGGHLSGHPVPNAPWMTAEFLEHHKDATLPYNMAQAYLLLKVQKMTGIVPSS